MGSNVLKSRRNVIGVKNNIALLLLGKKKDSISIILCTLGRQKLLLKKFLEDTMAGIHGAVECRRMPGRD